MHFREIVIFLLLATMLFSAGSISGQVFINEFVASNSSGFADPDFDKTGDWIELYNSSNQSVDISAYYLTDNLNQHDKWQFPFGTQIQANGYILIWADGQDSGLHTNFKLTKIGEELGLYNAQGEMIDSVVYTYQQTDISFGRKTDGSMDWAYFKTPTPDSENSETAYDGIVFQRPSFSIRGGFYDENLEVALSTINGDIRYSLDGSLPTLNSPLYESPLQVDTSTIIRAGVFIDNFIPGKAKTHSYFIDENLEEKKLPIISIATNEEFFWDDSIGLYVQDFKPDWKYPINIEFFENDGGNRAAFNELAGVKINGQNSWELPQKMLGIYFDNEYDNNNLDYHLFVDRRRNQYDNFTLRVGGSDWSSTIFRDGLTQGLTRSRMNLTTMGFRPSIVLVNGKYLGIHNIRSRIDEGFIEENYNLSGSEYDLIENNGKVEQGDDMAFDHLFDLMDEDLSNQANYDAVQEILDIENYIDFYCTEIWSSNSSYGHNIQLWKPKATGTKWQFIAQDFDRAFNGSDNNLIDFFSIEASDGYSWVASRFTNMLGNEEFSDRFLKRFADHLFTTFHPNRVIENINRFESQIELEMPFQIERWQGTTSSYGNAIPSFSYWKNEIQDLRDYSNERMNYVYNDLIEHFDVSETTTLGVFSDIKKGGQHFINEMSIPETNWSGTYLKNLDLELSVEPNVGYDFIGWSEGQKRLFIPKESEWKYYDLGELPDENWYKPEYEDQNWSSGEAQFGYGENDENTIISYGSNSTNKHISTYFRKEFVVDDSTNLVGKLSLRLLRDDGAVVYINGKEVLRSNMPTGEIQFDTRASKFVGGIEEDIYSFHSIDLDFLIQGNNLVAVEIHQFNPTSSDVSFDLELEGIEKNVNDIFSTNQTIPLNLSDEKYLIAHYSQNNLCLLPDTIRQDTTLKIDCSPYLVGNTVTIMSDVKLTIDPGVEFHFSERSGMIINGSIHALGTESQPIKFLPNDASGTSSWQNLFFENSTDTSYLEWVEIQGATRGLDPIKENAAIASWNSSIDLNHLILVDNYENPILARYSDVWLRNSRLHSKVTGDLINVKYGYGFIDRCEFKGNDKIDTDAIDYDEISEGVISNSKIYNFVGFNSDGIDLGENSENILIENNFIHHIADKGISVGQQSTIRSINNIIVECNQGIGVKDLGNALIDQNTFYNNACDVLAFEKNPGMGDGFLQIYNTIFSNSAFNPLKVDNESNLILDFVLSDTEALTGENVIFEDPLFANPSDNDFNLLNNSSAINTGEDEFGNPIDLGAKNSLYSEKPSLMFSAIHYHPLFNPDKEFIRIFNPSNEVIDLEGYTISEAVDFTFPEDVFIAENETIYLVKDLTLFNNLTDQSFEWTQGKLSNDGEQIILRDNFGIILDHVTYNDKLPWAESADGEGFFLELIDPTLDNHFGKNWKASLIDSVFVDEYEELKTIISPNPTLDKLLIHANQNVESLKIYNAMGQVLESIHPSNSTVRISLKNYANGVYFLLLNDEHSFKIIKS